MTCSFRVLAGVLVVSLALFSPLPARAADTPTYELSFGDAVAVHVLIEPPIAISQDLRPDGFISVPLVGDIAAVGLTIPALTKRLEAAYSRYYTKPRVVVTVTKFRPLRVTLVGLGLRSPGTFTVAEPISLIQALALAGGVNEETIKYDGVVLIRKDGRRLLVDLDKMLHGAEMTQALTMEDGDVLLVGGEPVPWARVAPFLLVAVSALNLLVTVFRR